MSRKDSARARLFRKICHFGTAIVTVEALIAKTDLCFIAGWSAYGHAEALRSYQITRD